MEVKFDREDLDRLETDRAFTAGLAIELVKGYRKLMQSIRAASDERTLYTLRGHRFEKLKGNRAHQHSLRLNKQWRLIVELRGREEKKHIAIVAIEDYH